MSDRTTYPDTHPEEHEMTPREARQGVTGHNVRYVLTIGLIGVVIGFAIAYFFFFPA